MYTLYTHWHTYTHAETLVVSESCYGSMNCHDGENHTHKHPNVDKPHSHDNSKLELSFPHGTDAPSVGAGALYCNVPVCLTHAPHIVVALLALAITPKLSHDIHYLGIRDARRTPVTQTKFFNTNTSGIVCVHTLAHTHRHSCTHPRSYKCIL